MLTIGTACAAQAGQFQTVVEQARKMVNGHQFNNEPLRVLLVSLSHGLRATDAFLASTLSKHLLRELRLSDTAVKQPDKLRWNPTTRRYAQAKTDAEDAGDDDEDVPSVDLEKGSHAKDLPTKDNPVNVAVYGQICLAAKSYQSALCQSSFSLLWTLDICGLTIYRTHQSICCTRTITARMTL